MPQTQGMFSLMKLQQTHLVNKRMLASLSPTPQGSRGQMELHVGGLCCRGGWNKRKQTAGFFSERPKEESENISRVSQYMRCLCGTRRISMHAAALECVGVCFLSEALGGGLTGEVTPSQRSFEGNCVKFHRHATTPAYFELSWMCITKFSQSLCRNRFFVLHKVLKIFGIWGHRSVSLILVSFRLC